MANYSYLSDGYTKPHDKSMLEPRFHEWDTANNGYDAFSPGWGRPDFANHDEGHQDHVCKPVIIDAQGRKRPIVSYGPTPHNLMNAIVTKTEAIIKKVHVPPASYRNNSPTKVGHGVLNNGWSKPHSPSRSSYWHQKEDSIGYNEPNSYGKSNNHGSHGWNKPSGHTMRDPYFGDYQGKHQTEHNGSPERTVISSGGWERPSHLGWAMPPNKDIHLTKPTNDIGTAINYLKDATNHATVDVAPTRPWLSVPSPRVPTIDSSEARRRYGNFSESPVAIKTTNTYSPTIDSREAVRRYGGQLM